MEHQLTCHGDTTEAKSLFDVKDILNDIVGAKDDWVRDKTILVALDGADHCSLLFSGLVVVDDTDTSKKLSCRLLIQQRVLFAGL